MHLIRFLFPIALAASISCRQPARPAPAVNTPEQTTVTPPVQNANNFAKNIAKVMDDRVLSILQDRNGHYWFGTQNAGAYRYDGKNLLVFTTKDGLFQNQIQTIQEDASGNIWFGTGGFGVSYFDGKTIISPILNKGLGTEKAWKITDNDLWFYAGGGVYHHCDSAFTYLTFPKPDFDAQYTAKPANKISAYSIYSTLKDRNGHLWMGTQTMGVCRYDGKSFTWFTEKGLRGPAVLDIFEDSYGRIWFGNNGNGLFCYDGKSLTNLSKDKGLYNPEFLQSGKQKAGTLTRVWAINEDNNGNIWIGTGDAGVWKYDGKNLVNYTEKDGIPNYPIETIYKDKGGQLWFGTNGGGVYKLNGTTFEKFNI